MVSFLAYALSFSSIALASNNMPNLGPEDLKAKEKLITVRDEIWECENQLGGNKFQVFKPDGNATIVYAETWIAPTLFYPGKWKVMKTAKGGTVLCINADESEGTECLDILYLTHERYAIGKTRTYNQEGKIEWESSDLYTFLNQCRKK